MNTTNALSPFEKYIKFSVIVFFCGVVMCLASLATLFIRLEFDIFDESILLKLYVISFATMIAGAIISIILVALIALTEK